MSARDVAMSVRDGVARKTRAGVTSRRTAPRTFFVTC
jgi:hypothetical protein